MTAQQFKTAPSPFKADNTASPAMINKAASTVITAIAIAGLMRNHLHIESCFQTLPAPFAPRLPRPIRSMAMRRVPAARD